MGEGADSQSQSHPGHGFVSQDHGHHGEEQSHECDVIRGWFQRLERTKFVEIRLRSRGQSSPFVSAIRTCSRWLHPLFSWDPRTSTRLVCLRACFASFLFRGLTSCVHLSLGDVAASGFLGSGANATFFFGFMPHVPHVQCPPRSIRPWNSTLPNPEPSKGSRRKHHGRETIVSSRHGEVNRCDGSVGDDVAGASRRMGVVRGRIHPRTRLPHLPSTSHVPVAPYLGRDSSLHLPSIPTTNKHRWNGTIASMSFCPVVPRPHVRRFVHVSTCGRG